jgi:NADH-quinone oxidoreductase subunit D
MSVFLYCFREREAIMNLFEQISGGRLTPSYLRIGGVMMDTPVGYEEEVAKFLTIFPSRIDEYEALLTENEIWRDRTIGVGILDAETALAWGVTGPPLRAAGVPYDVRKVNPYSGYENFEFDVPLGRNADVYDRYMVRVAEMRQSVRILHQVLDNLPDGPVNSSDGKVVLPPKERVLSDMEALIHHFILVTRGFPVPKGEAYACIESPKGELGFYVVADGSEKPYRVRVRPPSFYNLQVIPPICEGGMVADVVAIIGSQDIVLGEIDR